MPQTFLLPRWTVVSSPAQTWYFQQITEVFHLNRLMATTPQGTLFQLSFCLLLYNMIQVVRGYVAVGQGVSLEVISTELLFVDVSKQLVALNELVTVDRGGVAARAGFGSVGSAAFGQAAGWVVERQLAQSVDQTTQVGGCQAREAGAHLRLSPPQSSPSTQAQGDCHLTRKSVGVVLLADGLPTSGRGEHGCAGGPSR